MESGNKKIQPHRPSGWRGVAAFALAGILAVAGFAAAAEGGADGDGENSPTATSTEAGEAPSAPFERSNGEDDPEFVMPAPPPPVATPESAEGNGENSTPSPSPTVPAAAIVPAEPGEIGKIGEVGEEGENGENGEKPPSPPTFPPTTTTETTTATATRDGAAPPHPAFYPLPNAGRLTVRWFGHACFSLTYESPVGGFAPYTVVVDPYGPGLGYPVPELYADAVFISHEHSDHNNLAAVRPNAGAWTVNPDAEPARELRRAAAARPRHSFVVRGLARDGAVREKTGRYPDILPLEWAPDALPAHPGGALPDGGAILAATVPARHFADPRESGRGATGLFRWGRCVGYHGNGKNSGPDYDRPIWSGPTVVHLGDLGQNRLTEAQIAALRGSAGVDILLIPVGGVYTLDADRAVEVVGQLEPRVVVPMHYQTPALDMGEKPLAGVEPFVARLPVQYERRRLDGNEFTWPLFELLADDRARALDPGLPIKRLVIIPDWRAALTDPRADAAADRAP